MVMSAAVGMTNPVRVTEVPKIETNLVKETTKKEVENMMSTEKYVRQYFSDIPIMIQVARCESHFRQLDKDGNVHRGVVNDRDVGVMQINEYYHLDEAETLNYNLYTLDGNMAYARKLYEREGTEPWVSSKACWGKYENTIATTPKVATTTALAMNVK